MKTTTKLFLAAGAAAPLLMVSGAVFAQSSTTGASMRDTFASELAERFNLNKDEVTTFMNEKRAAREAERDTKTAEALKSAGFSDVQISALKSKREEQRLAHEAWHTANPDATSDERKAHRESEKTAFESWASSQGIDLEKVKTALQSLGGKNSMMGGRGRGMKGSF
jgi:hypothetical protein